MLPAPVTRIFICDDEPSYRALVRTVLPAMGDYEIVGEAADGQEAIELAPALDPEVILLDLHMPGMGGMEALPRLRELLPDARIIALTTTYLPHREQQFTSLGGYAFMEKPKDVFALPDLLEAALEEGAPSSLDLVGRLHEMGQQGRHDEALSYLHPDVEFVPLLSQKVYRGVDAWLKYYASLSADDREGRSRAIKLMLAPDNKVVLLAMVSFERTGPDGRRFTESVPAGWVLEVRDQKVISFHTFRSWDEARRAAGLGPGVAPLAERNVSVWNFLVGGLAQARSAVWAMIRDSWPPCQASGDLPGSSTKSSAPGIAAA
jgi:two-component system nitrate/nitrite response regulator NarL